MVIVICMLVTCSNNCAEVIGKDNFLSKLNRTVKEYYLFSYRANLYLHKI